MLVRFSASAALLGTLACTDSSGGQGVAAGGTRASDRPDEPPVLVNKDLPFRYPAPLYARRVQANVTLRLFIDRDGRVFADSTRVEESSGYNSLDSAAVKGSQELQFIPAKLHGEPVAVSVLFPVYFRHPEAPPLQGDSVLGKKEEVLGTRDTTALRPASPRP